MQTLEGIGSRKDLEDSNIGGHRLALIKCWDPASSLDAVVTPLKKRTSREGGKLPLEAPHQTGPERAPAYSLQGSMEERGYCS